MGLTEYNLETLQTYHPKDLDEDALFSVRRQNYLKACELVKAVGANDVEEVKKRLCYNDVSAEKVEFRKWYVNEKGLDDWIALHAAAEVGSLVLTQLLIDCGSRIDELSDVTYTPLHIGEQQDLYDLKITVYMVGLHHSKISFYSNKNNNQLLVGTMLILLKFFLKTEQTLEF